LVNKPYFCLPWTSLAFKHLEIVMYYFTWKENGLTKDCASLEAMAYRFEESAKLMKKMAKEGFILNKTKTEQLITHKNAEIFKEWGFINEASPYLQLTLIPDKGITLAND